MMIADAQIHLFADNADDYAAAIGQTIMSPQDIVREMDDAGVERAYLVPAGQSEANDSCLAAVKMYPDRFRVMGRISLVKPEGRALVDNWSQSGFIGVRMTFAPTRGTSWLADGTADWFWAAAEEKNIPVMIWAPRQAALIGQVAAKHPRLKLVVDHVNLFVEDKADAVRQEISEVLPLARHSNVSVKASSLPAHSNESYPFRDLHEPIKDVVSAFGAERVMWGTDLTRRSSTYREAIDLFLKEIPSLTEAQLEQIMGKSITRIVGW